ncbi:MAG: hypothetical protein CMI30_07330 [Opitutae bacterium]|nr:hypothetical protein [Opitutae bacterium]
MKSNPSLSENVLATIKLWEEAKAADNRSRVITAASITTSCSSFFALRHKDDLQRESLWRECLEIIHGNHSQAIANGKTTGAEARKRGSSFLHLETA